MPTTRQMSSGNNQDFQSLPYYGSRRASNDRIVEDVEVHSASPETPEEVPQPPIAPVEPFTRQATLADLVRIESDRQYHDHFTRLGDYVASMFRPSIENCAQRVEATEKSTLNCMRTVNDLKAYMEDKFGPPLAAQAANQRSNNPPYERVNHTPRQPVRILERGKNHISIGRAHV